MNREGEGRRELFLMETGEDAALPDVRSDEAHAFASSLPLHAAHDGHFSIPSPPRLYGNHSLPLPGEQIAEFCNISESLHPEPRTYDLVESHPNEFSCDSSAQATPHESQSSDPASCCCQEDPSGFVDEEDIPDDVKRRMLPDICKGIVILTQESRAPGGCCYVYLVGTAHVSQESCKEVQLVTSFLKPEVVFLELCERRRFMLSSMNFEVPTFTEMLNTWKEKRSNLLGVIYSWFLAKVAAKMEIFPGSEFRVAYEEAKTCGARIVLGDRDVQVTLRRTWGKMNLWYKLKFVFLMVFQAFSLPSVEELKEMIQGLQNSDMLTLAFQELGKSFPTVMDTLVHERDMFMTAVLQRVAENHSSVVAVVGKGHIPGIARHWKQEISVQCLMEVPKRVPIWSAVPKFYFLVPAVAVTGLLLLNIYPSIR